MSTLSMQSTTGATGASIGLEDGTDVTRTIAELVDRVGFLRNRTRVLVADSLGIHETAQTLHDGTLETLLRTSSQHRARESLSDLLTELSDLGFSWRDLSRVVGVSVPALRKWRHGESATGENRLRVARVAAFCNIVRDQYLIDEPASWLETPIHLDAPINGFDLLAADRVDLAFRLAGDHDADPESILDEFEPQWRQRFATSLEVFVADDSTPGLRFTEG